MRAVQRPVLIVVSISALLLLGALLWFWRQPLPSMPADFATKVLDRHGELLRAYTAEDGRWRFSADVSTIDPRFIKALLAIEDKRFYQHGGVDFAAIARAAYNNLMHGRVVSGASTITMQLARLLQPRSRGFSNKLKQAIDALKLEARYSKSEILAAYLTLTPYGGNIQGIEAAAWRYFDKSPGYLSTSEIALLLALPQAPEGLRPDRYPQRAAAKRNWVVERLAAAGVINHEQQRLAKSQALPQLQKLPFDAPHFTERFRRDNQQAVTTTINADLQQRVQGLLKRHQQGLPPGNTLALMLVENASREVLVHVGTADYFNQEFAGAVDMTAAVRSPGSALKPFIYGLAFEQGIAHPHTRVFDQPRNDAFYQPTNLDHSFRGEVDLTQALRQSLNLPAVSLLEKLGAKRFHQHMQNVGVELQFAPTAEAGLALALGGVGITLEDLTGLYVAQANKGEYRPLVYQMRDTLAVSKPLFADTASSWLDYILKGTSAPAGYLRNRHAIRFKTGTSYGYRDNWAFAYDNDYTLGVWVGRPDGAANNRQLGIETAAPIAFEVFNLLPISSQPMQHEALLSFEQLPLNLRWLGMSQSVVKQGGTKPSIYSPANEAEVLLQHTGVHFQVAGGLAPYHWYNDQQWLAQTANSSFTWNQHQSGFYRMVVVDSQGKSDQITVRLMTQNDFDFDQPGSK